MHIKKGVIVTIVIIIIFGSSITAYTKNFVSKQKVPTIPMNEAVGGANIVIEPRDLLVDEETESGDISEEVPEDAPIQPGMAGLSEDNSVYILEKAEQDNSQEVKIYVDPMSNLSSQKTPRENYEAKLAELEKQVARLWNEETNNTTYSMMNTAEYELASWDQELNIIYQMLKEKLSPDEFEELKLEERQWIKDRDAAAMKSARLSSKQNSEDVAKGLSYQIALAEETKKRTYELVDYYFSK